MSDDNVCFEVRRDALAETRVVTDPPATPGAGGALLRVDAFALTANNVTYGVAGDAIGYWQFFPAQDGTAGGWGRIPVWGFGDVVASEVDGLAAGDRVYGYFPMAGYLHVRPEHVGAHGFTDASTHRAELPPVYNHYTRTSTDPAYRPELETMQMLFRPLFTTSFFLDDFLDDNDFFGARTVVLSSRTLVLYSLPSLESWAVAWIEKL
jgi:hypothetical protein